MRATCYLLAVARDLWSRRRARLCALSLTFVMIIGLRCAVPVAALYRASDTLIYVRALYFFKSSYLVDCCIFTHSFFCVPGKTWKTGIFYLDVSRFLT